jgi:hypothetical protein
MHAETKIPPSLDFAQRVQLLHTVRIPPLRPTRAPGPYLSLPGPVWVHMVASEWRWGRLGHGWGRCCKMSGVHAQTAIDAQGAAHAPTTQQTSLVQLSLIICHRALPRAQPEGTPLPNHFQAHKPKMLQEPPTLCLRAWTAYGGQALGNRRSREASEQVHGHPGTIYIQVSAPPNAAVQTPQGQRQAAYNA